MAAPDELFCWEGDWGLPSVDTDCLVVLVSAGPDWTEPTFLSDFFLGSRATESSRQRWLALALACLWLIEAAH